MHFHFEENIGIAARVHESGVSRNRPIADRAGHADQGGCGRGAAPAGRNGPDAVWTPRASVPIRSVSDLCGLSVGATGRAAPVPSFVAAGDTRKLRLCAAVHGASGRAQERSCGPGCVTIFAGATVDAVRTCGRAHERSCDPRCVPLFAGTTGNAARAPFWSRPGARVKSGGRSGSRLAQCGPGHKAAVRVHRPGSTVIASILAGGPVRCGHQFVATILAVTATTLWSGTGPRSSMLPGTNFPGLRKSASTMCP